MELYYFRARNIDEEPVAHESEMTGGSTTLAVDRCGMASPRIIDSQSRGTGDDN